MPAFIADDMILEDLMVINPTITEPATSPMISAAPSSKSGSEAASSNHRDTSSNPDSRSSSQPRIEKRKANTLAARRYRQNRLDKLTTLEAELKATQDERDALKVQVARLQGETEVLRDMVRKPQV